MEGDLVRWRRIGRSLPVWRRAPFASCRHDEHREAASNRADLRLLRRWGRGKAERVRQSGQRVCNCAARTRYTTSVYKAGSRDGALVAGSRTWIWAIVAYVAAGGARQCCRCLSGLGFRLRLRPFISNPLYRWLRCRSASGRREEQALDWGPLPGRRRCGRVRVSGTARGRICCRGAGGTTRG